MKKQKQGFALIETLVSLTIFAFFAASVFSLVSVNIRGGVINKHRLQAGDLAREGIVQVMPGGGCGSVPLFCNEE